MLISFRNFLIGSNRFLFCSISKIKHLCHLQVFDAEFVWNFNRLNSVLFQINRPDLEHFHEDVCIML